MGGGRTPGSERTEKTTQVWEQHRGAGDKGMHPCPMVLPLPGLISPPRDLGPASVASVMWGDPWHTDQGTFT